MQVGDLVKYVEYHTGLQGLIGLVIEVRFEAHGDDRARILWSATRPSPIRWDWVEELRIIQ